MTVTELYNYIDARIPRSLSLEGDNDGLMCCPDPENNVKKVLLALDITEKTVDTAIAENADVIIAHHPLIFKPIFALSGDGTPSILIKLVKNGISAMSFHTRLDVADGGVNDILAALCGLSEVKPLCPDGLGRVGELASKNNINSYAEFVKNALNSPVISYSDSARDVKKIAVVGGSGKSCIADAISCGADTLVTGEAGFHALTDSASLGINVIEAGHYFTEAPVLAMLKDLVESADKNIVVKTVNSFDIRVI